MQAARWDLAGLQRGWLATGEQKNGSTGTLTTFSPLPRSTPVGRSRRLFVSSACGPMRSACFPAQNGSSQVLALLTVDAPRI